MTGTAPHAPRPRRIVFVTHSAAAAGAELLLLRLVATAAAADGPGAPEVRVLVCEDGPLPEALRAAGVACKALQAGGIHRFRREAGATAALRHVVPALKTARAIAAELRPDDIVVATSQKAFLLCALIPRPRHRLVWWLHDILSREHFSAFAIRTAVTLSRLACTRIIVTSPEARAAYVAAGGSEARSVVVEPGIDLECFAPSARPDAAPPPEAPLARSPVVVISVSRISPWKGQLALVEALARLPGVEGWIVGAPLFGETDYRDALMRRARELRAEDRIRFLGHREDIPDLLGRASLFAHVPEAPEPFGQVVVEAMASGLPIIATRTGALSRIVDGSFGIFVEPRDVTALASAISDLAADPAARRRMGAAARTAARRFDIAAMRRSFFSQLESVRP